MARSYRAAGLPLSSILALLLIVVPRLNAQQPDRPAAPAPQVAAPAPAVTAPAPQASLLFQPAVPEAPTIAAARKADAESRRGNMHTITMSTTVLILVVVILVLLIA